MEFKQGKHFKIKEFDCCNFCEFTCRSYAEIAEHLESNHLDILEEMTDTQESQS